MSAIHLQLEKLTKKYADARAALVVDRETLAASIRDQASVFRPKIIKQAEKVAQLEADIRAIVAQNPDLFPEGAKTQEVNGINVGFLKAKDSVAVVEGDSEGGVIDAIKAYFPEKAEMLVNTKETLSLTACAKLKDDDLEKIGMTRVIGKEEVLFKPIDGSEINKFIKAVAPEAVKGLIE